MERMTDLASLFAQYKDLPVDAQKRAGQSTAAAMGSTHEAFIDMILALLKKEAINPYDPESLLNHDVYERLSDAEKSKVDRALPNICDQLRRIVEFRLSKETPDRSAELQTMIEYLWQMKQRIEEQHDVLKF